LQLDESWSSYEPDTALINASALAAFMRIHFPAALEGSEADQYKPESALMFGKVAEKVFFKLRKLVSDPTAQKDAGKLKSPQFVTPMSTVTVSGKQSQEVAQHWEHGAPNIAISALRSDEIPRRPVFGDCTVAESRSGRCPSKSSKDIHSRHGVGRGCLIAERHRFLGVY
jgi:hypothetical protein